MKIKDIEHLSRWFNDYVGSFYSGYAEDDRNYTVKEFHTARVRENIASICDGIDIDDNKRMLGDAVALFHDLGRFRQYRDYKTFGDSDSVNHAALSSKVLIDNNVLGALSKSEQDVIIRAINLHNAFELPEGLDEDVLLMARLIRDADKLDIWRVFIEHYRTRKEDRASAVTLELPDWPAYSEGILECLNEGRMARLAQLRTQDDFRLLQLSWIYDLNFRPTFEMVVERGIIEDIALELPEEPEIIRAVNIVKRYVQQRLTNP